MIEFLLTYLLHSTILLTGALLLVRLPGLRRASAREALFRTALLAGVVTAWGQHAPLQISVPPPSVLHSTAVGISQQLPEGPAEAVAFDSSGATVVPGVVGANKTTTEYAAGLVGTSTSVIPALLLALLVLFVVLRFAWAGIVLRRLLRQAEPVRDPNVLRLLNEATAATRGTARINLLETSAVTTPFAVGWRTLVLPTDFSARLTPDGVRSVLAHELAHLERRDPVWNALLSFVSSMLVFQPLNLVVLRCWRDASEEMCDARAVERTGAPVVLARSLLEFARAPSSVPSVVATGVAGRSHLTSRVEALLKNKETRMSKSHLALMTVLPLVLGLLLPNVSLAQATDREEALLERKVVIDPGHGGTTEEAQGSAREGDVVLAIAQKAREILEEQGIDVVMTREDDVDVNLATRAATAAGADAFVSIHAGGGASDSKGVQAWYAEQSASSNPEARSRRLADALQIRLVEGLQAQDRGVTPGEYYVLQNAGAPAAMVEVGSLTDPEEGPALATADYQQRVAQAIADAIIIFLLE